MVHHHHIRSLTVVAAEARPEATTVDDKGKEEVNEVKEEAE